MATPTRTDARRSMRWMTALLAGTLTACTARPPPPRLLAMGPRLTSNQTSEPLQLIGESFRPGMKLRLGNPASRTLAVTHVDARHAFARLPAGMALPSDTTTTELSLRLEGDPGPGASLTVINDERFVDPQTLTASPDGRFLLALSPPTDTGYLLDVATGKVRTLKLADGPSAAAAVSDVEGHAAFIIAHRFGGGVWRIPLDAAGNPGPHAVLSPLNGGVGLCVGASGQVLYVAEDVEDTVAALDAKTGRVLWRTPVAPNPRELALVSEGLAVGSLQAGVVDVLALADGHRQARIQPGPGVEILGGHTEPFGREVMGGKAVRALAYSASHSRLFVSSVGPNVGPNPQRMEVTLNGGVGVVDPVHARFERHVGHDAGIPEGLALDDARGLLYVADIGLGEVRIYRSAALTGTPLQARAALLQTVALPAPAAFPRIRPDAELGGGKRAGPELHSGPRALVLRPDGRALYVLNRFTATVAVLDVREAPAGKAVLERALPLVPLEELLTQGTRRLGEVLYFTDVGRTGMSCDACHLEGHTEGIFFEKTHPMRIYRSSTIRGARETPPYFTPASTTSMAQTSLVVGNRNRFHNPDLSPREVEALTVYASALPTLPNPYAGEDGAPPEALTLPDGTKGRPRQGLALFQARCEGCHPPPLFTTDQDVATRGRYLSVGTPRALPLRVGLQELVTDAFAPPSLVGAWDIFPMLTSGAAGLEVTPGGSIQVSEAAALDIVLGRYSGPQHGNAQALSAEERRDLSAYVRSL